MTIKNGILSGALAGVVWGWVSMAVNSVTGVTSFEGSFAHNIMSFTFAGGVFGIVAGGVLSVVAGVLPFRGIFLKAVIVSSALWLILRFAGSMLSQMHPHRFNIIAPEMIQGLVLAIILGVFLGLISSKGLRQAEER